MNYIGIDPSLTSTGIVINNTLLSNFTSNALTKKGTLNKWNSYGAHLIDLHHHQFNNKLAEIDTFEQIQNIANEIFRYVVKSSPDKNNTTIAIESYAFNSTSSAFIELVALSSLIRDRIIRYYGAKNVNILPPTQVKKYMGALTYPKCYTNKKQTKWMWRNNDGVASGSFKKAHMYKALLDNKEFIGDKYVEFLRQNELVLCNYDKGSVIKPFEDVNDAFILCLIAQNLDLLAQCTT